MYWEWPNVSGSSSQDFNAGSSRSLRKCQRQLTCKSKECYKCSDKRTIFNGWLQGLPSVQRAPIHELSEIQIDRYQRTCNAQQLATVKYLLLKGLLETGQQSLRDRWGRLQLDASLLFRLLRCSSCKTEHDLSKSQDQKINCFVNILLNFGTQIMDRCCWIPRRENSVVCESFIVPLQNK